ncbi:hypothetical protein [Cognatiyoonia sp. IB215182]|uniref:hypothetical protein n=1 Tax=Cognatiyoonia sp. IB215182 TaxID=3097353 RepID=UPI002A12E244|nr:hypothetical protein [Cognatiyoonia sp. IB215182]MDX8355784.1 hypothetical protein [Cognatiyoonia sp. IB215182]
MVPAPLILDLVGPVSLHDRNGYNLTPRLMRSRAVLALLGATEGYRRSRSWIQDKLWSDKTKPEGSAALRYALWDLRRSLGDHRAALICEHGYIALDPNSVQVRLPETVLDGPVFAEGLDIDDAEFEVWLSEQRNGGAAARAAPFLDEGRPYSLRSVVRIYPNGGDDDHLNGLAQTLAIRTAARLTRTTGALVRIDPDDDSDTARFATELRVDLRLSRVRGRVLAQVSVANTRRDEIIWTNDRDLPGGLVGQDPLNPFANLTAEAIGRALMQLPPDASDVEHASAAFCKAMSMPRSFDACDLLDAIQTLGALEIDEVAARSAARRALYLGWLVIERKATCEKSALEEARALSRRSIELDPTLSEAFAVRSELADFDRNPALAHDLAQYAVNIDPFDPLAVAALSKAEARLGDGQSAYKRALFAQQLAVGLPNPAWWATLCCTTAMSHGNTTLALRHAETAHELAAGFLPPLRFLAALRFMADDLQGCRSALSSLAAKEPGFSPDILTEPEYPLRSIDVAILRQLRQAKVV